MATTAPLPPSARPLQLAPVSPPGRMPLARMDLFVGLPDADVALLERRLSLVRWPRGADVPEPLSRPDHLYLVREGRLGIFERTAPGHQIMTALLESGSLYPTLGEANIPGVH